MLSFVVPLRSWWEEKKGEQKLSADSPCVGGCNWAEAEATDSSVDSTDGENVVPKSGGRE